MLVIPSLKKYNKLELLLFTNALGRQANVQTHKNSKLYKIQRRAPLFMVSQKKSKIFSWCIHNTKTYLKRIKNEKVMVLNAPPSSLMDSITSPKVKITKGKGVGVCSLAHNTSGVEGHVGTPRWD